MKPTRPHLVPLAGRPADRTTSAVRSEQRTGADPDTTESTFVVDPEQDPRDVFLRAEDVHAYLGKGRTQGYEFTSQSTFQALQAVSGRWRLADVRAYFDLKAELALEEIRAALRGEASDPQQVTHDPTAETNPRSRSRRADATVGEKYPFVEPRRRSNPPGTPKGRKS